MAKPRPKMLTVKCDLQMLAEFHAAAQILRARSASEHVHQFMVRSIDEARGRVTAAEFNKLATEKMESIKARSVQKAKERKRKEQGGTSPRKTLSRIA